MKFSINYNDLIDKYEVGYKYYYNGLNYRWTVVEYFYNEDVAKRFCDELNAKKVIEEIKYGNVFIR